MIKFLRRAVLWWWRELRKPWASDPPKPPMNWGDSSEPLEPTEHKISARIDLAKIPIHPLRPLTDRDLMTTEERELWEDIEGGKPKHEPINYPPVREQSTQDWVTERLEALTGGLTRHPYDLTQYPTPPTEADKAAREYVQHHYHGPRALFSHGYSMAYLHSLLRRADQRDMTLTAEELMGLRSRGLA